MNKVKMFLAATGVTLVAFAIVAFAAVKQAFPAKGFVVIELYTSEGCSSCPPADALVAQIQKEYKSQQVYILAFHVDYWNRLGWRDVFSDAAYSTRQYDYAKYLKLPQVYTPKL
ncbi:DUF1223 domain-containing protein [Mucilaginibacter antarcticus]|uniref:DUF1223 domain-containing protein n=1 Tax=Mucilaginibacter antarcticus TaxID=1855725 RepID=UPI00363902B7